MNLQFKCSFYYVVCLCSLGLFLFYCLVQTGMKLSPKMCSSTSITTSAHSKRNFIDVDKMKKNKTWKDDFQHVTDKETVLVYSAYADGRTKVRVIGITNDTDADVHCLLWYDTSDITTKLVKAHIANINENHGKSHTAAYFLCYLCGLKVPDAVSIVMNTTSFSPRNILPVHVKPQLQTRKHFTMCLSPMHSSFSGSSDLSEWIELNKLFGVQKFILYVKSVSSEVKKVLDYYQNQQNSMVEVLPWTLSDALCNDVLLHYCGQLAALNDCLYRSKGYSYYISATDLDEFIIPQHKHDLTWLDMLLRLPDQSVYLLRNSFVMRNQNLIKGDDENNMLMTDYLMRDNFIYGPRDRSKMIAWTDDVVTLGIHNVWAMSSGNEYGVDTNIGLLHHYRKSPVKYPDGVNVTRIKSDVTVKYSQELRDRLSKVREKHSSHTTKI